MFTDTTETEFTSGQLSNVVLNDEMFLVDQEIIAGFDSNSLSVPAAYSALLTGLGITFVAQPSGGFVMAQAWTVGTHRGAIMDTLAVSGDYFSPWFGNDASMHLVRTFNPVDQVPQFDWELGNQVIREGITHTSNILTAPNRFVVISNTNAQSPVVGTATVSVNAPNSFANRGFYLSDTRTLQLSDASQAQAVARGLANRGTIFETTTLSTVPDPRHDSYDVIRWRGSTWLELAWSMQLIEGGKMQHTLRKGYGQ
jgi:hypothetical protein